MCLIIYDLYFLRLPNTWIGLIPGSAGPCDCGRAGTAECVACRRSWAWSDGTIFDYDGFHDWAYNEPQIYEKCARLIERGWAARDCYFGYSYICKIGKLTIKLHR